MNRMLKTLFDYIVKLAMSAAPCKTVNFTIDEYVKEYSIKSKDYKQLKKTDYK